MLVARGSRARRRRHGSPPRHHRVGRTGPSRAPQPPRLQRGELEPRGAGASVAASARRARASAGRRSSREAGKRAVAEHERPLVGRKDALLDERERRLVLPASDQPATTIPRPSATTPSVPRRRRARRQRAGVQAGRSGRKPGRAGSRARQRIEQALGRRGGDEAPAPSARTYVPPSSIAVLRPSLPGSGAPSPGRSVSLPISTSAGRSPPGAAPQGSSAALRKRAARSSGTVNSRRSARAISYCTFGHCRRPRRDRQRRTTEGGRMVRKYGFPGWPSRLCYSRQVSAALACDSSQSGAPCSGEADRV
jgi:hypothetical protein